MPSDPDLGPGRGAGEEESERFLVDRRSGLDRRRIEEQRRALFGEGAGGGDDGDGDVDAGSATDLNRRRGPGRRRSDFTEAAEEGHLSKEQFLFLMAIDDFKRANNKTFPTWTDVLEVVRLLGYRKTAPSEIRIPRAEDWREKPDAPSKVRDKPGHRTGGGGPSS
ncbi:MAG: hypothetical protein ACTS3F_02870 [Phycisphaerales bacterium]